MVGERKPRLHIDAKRQAGICLFTVRKNGIGIDLQFSDRIFLPFRAIAHSGAVPRKAQSLMASVSANQ